MTALITRLWSVVRDGPWVLPFLAALTVMCFLEGGMATAFQDAKANQYPVPKVYALVLIAREQPRILHEQSARMDRKEFADYLDLQVALLKSQLVLKGALRVAEVTKLETVKQQKDPTAWLAGRLQVDADKRTGILRVAVNDGEPEEQALLANAVAKAYLVETIQLETGRKEIRLDKLKHLYAEYDTSLREKRAVLRQMSRTIGGADAKLLELRRQFTQKQLVVLEKELLEVWTQVRKAKIDIVLAKAWAQENPADTPLSPAAIDQAVRTSPGAARFLDEIRQLEAAVATLKKTSPDPNKEPAYQKAVERLESTKKELHEKLRVDLEAIQHTAQSRLTQLSKVEALLDIEWRDRVRAIQGVKNDVVDLDWLRDEIREMDVVVQQIAQEMQLLQLEIQAPQRVKILQSAEAPRK